MGDFVTNETEPTLWNDKSAAPGLAFPQGLTEANVWRAVNAQSTKNALLDIRNHLRGYGTIVPTDSDFGADPTATDNTDAFQAAINYAIAHNMRRILVPPGQFNIQGLLDFKDAYGLSFVGSARDKCVLKWTGSSGTPMLRARNSQYVTFESFRMIGNTNASNRPNCFIQSLSDTTYARTYVPTGLTVRDVLLGTGSANEATYGIRYSHTGTSSDTNNSEGLFQGVLIQGVTEAGYSFEHSQAKANKIFHGGVVIAKCAVATNRDTNQGGSFSWDEAAASACSVACFDLGGSNDPIYIQRLTSEGCARLLQIAGAAGGTFGVTLQSCRFSTDALHADNKAIKYTYRGPLNIIGCLFDSGGNPADIELNFSTDGVANIIGNAWNSANSNATSRIVIAGSPGRVNMQGNVYSDGVGAMTAQAHSGTFTVSDLATTGAVTFNVPEHDTSYRLSPPVPTTLTGSPSAGSTSIRSIAKTTSGFTVTLVAAPGAGTSVAFDWTISRT